MALVETLVPGAAKTSSLHRGPRYRSALRVDFAGDARPAVIGGVLTRWPRGAGRRAGRPRPHLRRALGQQRSGQPVATPGDVLRTS
jgi:hypothetical protein